MGLKESDGEGRCLKGQGDVSPLPRDSSTLGFGAEHCWGCFCWQGWEGSRVIRNCSRQTFQRWCWVSLQDWLLFKPFCSSNNGRRTLPPAVCPGERFCALGYENLPLRKAPADKQCWINDAGAIGFKESRVTPAWELQGSHRPLGSAAGSFCCWFMVEFGAVVPVRREGALRRLLCSPLSSECCWNRTHQCLGLAACA